MKTRILFALVAVAIAVAVLPATADADMFHRTCLRRMLQARSAADHHDWRAAYGLTDEVRFNLAKSSLPVDRRLVRECEDALRAIRRHDYFRAKAIMDHVIATLRHLAKARDLQQGEREWIFQF